MLTETKHLFKISIILIALLYCTISSSFASGFFNQEQSISGFGRANAGSSAYGSDSSIIFFNPAGMTLLEKAQGYNGTHVLIPKYDFDNKGSTIMGNPINSNAGQNPFGVETIPNIYFAAPVYDKNVWLGLGITSPFGLGSKFDSDWFGRYDAIKSNLLTVDIQPSVGVRVNNWLSVGGGIDVQYMKSELTNAVFDTREGLSKLEGDDWTTGYNVGVLLKPSDNINLGLHYRSAISHEAKGRVSVQGTSTSDFNSKAKANLDLPDILSIGLAYQPNKDWRLLGHVNWFGWSAFEDLTVKDLNNNILQKTVLDFDNSLSLALGVENYLNDDWTLRTGIQYSQTPTHIRTRSARIPDSNRTWLAAGASYKLTDKWTLDFAAGYTIFKDTNISNVNNGGNANFKASRSGGALNTAVGIKFDF